MEESDPEAPTEQRIPVISTKRARSRKDRESWIAEKGKEEPLMKKINDAYFLQKLKEENLSKFHLIKHPHHREMHIAIDS